MSANDGGPAFPVAFVQGMDPHGADVAPGDRGMSLRDWFAGQALAGLLACPEVTGNEHTFPKCAYNYADAMLKARDQ